MKNSAAIKDINALYTKHGWQLRRVLAADPDAEGFSAEELAGVEFEQAEIDALWFSRRSAPEQEAWELRRVFGSPFALLEVIPDDFSDDEREFVLKAVEERMIAAANSG